jgi:hypothetical protein
MHPALKENIAKNALVLVAIGIICSHPHNFIGCTAIEEDAAAAGSILTAVSLISVIACFGCFAFTYEKVRMKSAWQRLLAHFTTGVLLLAVGISLALVSTLAKIIAGPIFAIDLLIAITYIGCVCYDFWDLLRATG